MSKRVTIKISELVSKTNQMLRESTCDAKIREGMIAVLESALHATNQYRGFGYLTQEEVPPGENAGILKTGDTNKPVVFPDETRRFYYG